MADDFLAWQNPSSTDERLDTESLTVGALNVHRERIQVTGTGATDIAPVSAADGLLVNLGANNDVTVTGTVTANAGTNLNTSLLALEAGGNLAATSTSLAIIDDWDETNRAAVNPIAGQVGIQGDAGVVTALTTRVAIATNANVVDTELPAAATLSDGYANISVPALGALWMEWNGSSWDRAPKAIPSTYSFLSTAAVQAVTVKGSPGILYAMQFFNSGATPQFSRLYNMSTTPATTDTPVWRGMIPGNTGAAGFVVVLPERGMAFTLGISLRVTGAVADNDNTSLSANAIMGNLQYR